MQEDNNKNNNNNSLKKILHMLEDKNIKYYDDEINSLELKTIKALVSYMDLESQKQMAFIIKIFEFNLLMDLYSKKINAYKQANNNNKNKSYNNSDLKKGLINALKIYLPDNFFDIAKIIIKTFYDDNNNYDHDKDNKKNLSADLNLDLKSKKDDDILLKEILNDDAFKNLAPENIELLKNFIKDISNKSPLEAINIIIKYNNKMPKNISDQQKNLMINALLKKMPPDKKQQFINLYNSFYKN